LGSRMLVDGEANRNIQLSRDALGAERYNTAWEKARQGLRNLGVDVNSTAWAENASALYKEQAEILIGIQIECSFKSGLAALGCVEAKKWRAACPEGVDALRWYILCLLDDDSLREPAVWERLKEAETILNALLLKRAAPIRTRESDQASAWSFMR
jgi:hypothetical protein